MDLGDYIHTEVITPEYKKRPNSNDWYVSKKGSYTVSKDPVVSPNGTFVKNYYKSGRHEIDWLEYIYGVMERKYYIGNFGDVEGANVELVDTCRGLRLYDLYTSGLTAPYLNYDVAIDPGSKGFAIMGEKFKLLVSPNHKVTRVEDLKDFGNIDFNNWCAST